MGRYSTFCNLAGVSPADPQPGLPDIDSLNVWTALTTDTPSPRTEIPLGYCSPEANCDETASPRNVSYMLDSALISGKYKVITGYQGGLGFYQGPQFPNGSEPDTNPG
jgi:hypothetical protein